VLEKPFRILGLKPSTTCLGFAFFQEADLRDWGVKVVKGKWSKSKKRKLLSLMDEFIQRFEPDFLAVKRLHPSRSSSHLDELVRDIKAFARENKVSVRERSIGELERFFCREEKPNKNALAEQVARSYPVLYREFQKEKSNRHPYHMAAFEAVALGAVCFHLEDRHRRSRNGAFR